MIDLVNNQFLTQTERQTILKRALHSQPFFNLLTLEIVAEAVKRHQYGAKAKTDKDFWLTEVKANFGDVFVDTASLFDLSIYTANTGKSLHRYIAGELIPTPFQTTEARFDTAFAQQIFQDTQRELMPYLIKRGDSIIADARNVDAKIAAAVIKIVLSGYYTIADSYLADNVLQRVNESLANDIEYDEWKFTVDFTGQKVRTMQNDRFPRLVLGFGIVDKDINKANVSEGTFVITDTFRGLRFNNDPIPIEYFAPRLVCLRDVHQYYLPIEYLWEPFAPLRFDVVNTLHGGSGYELVMLTRTV